jgi:hypothetical protein
MVSYIPSPTCVPGWSAGSYNYYSCSGANVTPCCSSSSCTLSSCIIGGYTTNACISGISPRGRGGTYVAKCTDSFVYNPTNVTMVFNQTSSNCVSTYLSVQVYKPSKCLDQDFYNCTSTSNLLAMESKWMHWFCPTICNCSIQIMRCVASKLTPICF